MSECCSRHEEANEALRAALVGLTDKRPCPHGYMDVIHVAPAHWESRGCPHCGPPHYRPVECNVCAAIGGGAQSVPDSWVRREAAISRRDSGYVTPRTKSIVTGDLLPWFWLDALIAFIVLMAAAVVLTHVRLTL